MLRHSGSSYLIAVGIAAFLVTTPAAQKKPQPQPQPNSGPILVRLPELTGTVNSQVSDVNDANVIVGTMWDSSDHGSAAVWIPSGSGWRLQVIEGGWLHPAGPFPRAINDANDILLNRYGIARRASVWIPDDAQFARGTEVALPLWGDRCCSYAQAMDDNGTILGSVHNPEDPVTGALTDAQRVVWVANTSGGWDVFPLDLNCEPTDPGESEVRCGYNAISKLGGWIGGTLERQASNGWWGRAARALINSGGLVGPFELLGNTPVLPDPPVPPVSGVLVINSSGQSAGYSWPCAPDGSAGCHADAVFWDWNGTMTPLATYQASANRTAARANGINEAGEVVGWATFRTSGKTSESAAAWWKDPGASPVRLGVSKPLQSAEAVAINNSFLVIGEGRGSSGPPHAVVWILPK